MITVNDNYPKSNSEISDTQLKELALQHAQQQEIKRTGFPTEIVSLPSQGKVYSESNPLSSGTVEMKYMTAREEDILTSANLIRQGIVLEKLMQSMIVSPMQFEDLIIGDKNAIMIAARVLGYGKEYTISVECPNCGEKEKVHIDLTTLPTTNIPEDATMVSPGVFEFELPQSKRTIWFKLLTIRDDKRISKELETLKKTNKTNGIDRELTTRLKNLIVSVDGNADKQYIANFVDNELFAMDSRALRTYIRSVTPDVQFAATNFICGNCSHEEEALAFTIDTNFFWPKA